MQRITSASDRIAARSIRLQGVGWGAGTPAQEIKPGDKLMWNYGYISEVLEIVPKSAQFLTFTLKGEKGTISQRVMKKDRLVARCKP